jgi:hypothetical protein
MIKPIDRQPLPGIESPKAWAPFFNAFSYPVEDQQKKQILDGLSFELARQIQHHLKKMKEHYRKLREEHKT